MALAPVHPCDPDFTRQRRHPSFRPSHYVLLRVSALGRALLCVVGLALTAPLSRAHAHEAHAFERDAGTRIEQPVIESSNAPPADDVRAGEQLQVVSTGVRSVVRAPANGSGAVALESPPSSVLLGDVLRWCDVVQCRRLGGAMLLGFATPPPTHR